MKHILILILLLLNVVGNPKDIALKTIPKTDVISSILAKGNSVKYTEHTVNPRPSNGPLDKKRIITGDDASVWATEDHYFNWIRVK